MKSLLFVCCLVLLSFRSFGADAKPFRNTWGIFSHEPDIYRNVTELIASKSYPVEEHVVQTKDGFLLSVQRIPHGRDSVHSGKKQVVYLQHGLISASSDWVLNFPEQSLGFILADLGYDVWLGNTRGNDYSRHHIKLDPSMDAFWNYSFDEMATYDLPAIIDYVLDKTSEKQLFYIGHSQGTTSAFALLSENPIYNEKIKLFVALAPVAHVGHVTGFAKYIAPFTPEIELFSKIFGIHEFLQNSTILQFLTEEGCDSDVRAICENFYFVLFGYDKSHLNETRLGVYLTHFPAGSSIKSLAHFGQMVMSRKFRKFDYGRHNNEHYNQSTPPDYDVSKITTPTALFLSSKDDLADLIDVKELIPQLKSLVVSHCVRDNEFNHLDFVIATDARKLVYEQVIALMHKYI